MWEWRYRATRSLTFVFTRWVRAPSTHLIGGWLDHGASLDAAPAGNRTPILLSPTRSFGFVLTELSRLCILKVGNNGIGVREASEPGVPHAEPILPAVSCFIIFGDQLSALAATSGTVLCSHPHGACDVSVSGTVAALVYRDASETVPTALSENAT
jgi:hypothetical protein